MYMIAKRKLTASIADYEVVSFQAFEQHQAIHISETYFACQALVTSQHIIAINEAKQALRMEDWDEARRILEAADFTEVEFL
jgi:hypothetical protein